MLSPLQDQLAILKIVILYITRRERYFPTWKITAADWWWSRGPRAHGGRIYTEDKAKVVAAVWGTECIQFLVGLAFLHQDDMKNRINSSYSSYLPGAKQLAR